MCSLQTATAAGMFPAGIRPTTIWTGKRTASAIRCAPYGTWPSCTACRSDQIAENNACVCPAGKAESGGVCRCTGGKLDEGDSCVDSCTGDNLEENGYCVASCSGGNLEEGGLCVSECSAGYELEGNVCYTCPAGQTAIDGTTICVADSDLEFRDWCHARNGEILNNGQCRAVLSGPTPCAPFTYRGFTPGGANAGKTQCENEGQSACGDGGFYSTETHSCACLAGSFMDGSACVSECPAGEYPVDGVSCSALTDAEAEAALHAEIQKDSPNTGVVREFLKVADADGTLNGVALLIVAATLGHAEVVSVLITAGADAGVSNAAFFDSNVAHMMGARDGTTLTRAQKRVVLRHFGDAINLVGSDFDWNGGNQHNNTPLGLLRDAVGFESGGQLVVIAEMGDYVLSQGGGCPLTGAYSSRYHATCVGTLGKVLSDAVNAGNATAASVLAAAHSVTAAGVSLRFVGDASRGPLTRAAAFHRHAAVLSVLVTLGAPAEHPSGVSGGGKSRSPASGFAGDGQPRGRGAFGFAIFHRGVGGCGEVVRLWLVEHRRGHWSSAERA